MTALLAMLKGKALFALFGVGGGALALLLSKFVPNLVGKYAERWLEKALDVRNEEDREVVYALVRWAEKKVPEAGTGVEKYALVAKKVTSLFPVMKKYEDRISRLIESSVERLNKELKKVSK